MLGGMAWVGWHIHRAVDDDKVFTRNELSDMFSNYSDISERNENGKNN